MRKHARLHAIENNGLFCLFYSLFYPQTLLGRFLACSRMLSGCVYTDRMKPTYIEIDGQRVNGPKLAKRAGISWETVSKRLRRGWSVVDAFALAPAKRAPGNDLKDRIDRHRALAARHIELANALQIKLEGQRERVAKAQQGAESEGE